MKLGLGEFGTSKLAKDFSHRNPFEKHIERRNQEQVKLEKKNKNPAKGGDKMK